MPYDLHISLTLTTPSSQVFTSLFNFEKKDSTESCNKTHDAILSFFYRKRAYNGPIFCLLVPGDTRKLSSFMISLLVPTTARLMTKADSVALKIFLFIPALLLDLITIPIRFVVTAIPRAIYQNFWEDRSSRETKWSFRGHDVVWKAQDENVDDSQPHLQRGILTVDGDQQQIGSQIQRYDTSHFFLGF